jgi:thiol peroxidase
MSERSGAVTFKGNPMTLVGEELQVGQTAPDFQLTANDLSAKTRKDFEGKVVILATVPSLDTSVCDTQTRQFNEKATGLSDDIVVLTVSLDLPFAQKRWCGAAGAERVVTLSDYKDHQFGIDYGLRIKELGLLARSVSVLDRQGKVVYHELVKEVTNEPNYQAALEAAKKTA